MQQILKKEKKSPKQEKFMKCKFFFIYFIIFAFCVKIPLKNPQTTYTKEMEKKKKS